MEEGKDKDKEKQDDDNNNETTNKEEEDDDNNDGAYEEQNIIDDNVDVNADDEVGSFSHSLRRVERWIVRSGERESDALEERELIAVYVFVWISVCVLLSVLWRRWFRRCFVKTV